MNIEIEKKNQRKSANKKREKLFSENKNTHVNFIRNLEKLELFKKAKIVGSFVSIRTEISTLEINHFILKNDKQLCLPKINGMSNELIFKEYDFKSKLVAGKYGTQEPNNNNQDLLPEIILTPCLAFDLQGYRLGYGGGYYDKTFDFYEKINHHYISIVVAYSGQKVDKVFHNDLDKRIDYVLTEKELYKIK